MANYYIANLAYNEPYVSLFLNNHLKSILDESNLPSLAKEHSITYLLFGDNNSLQQIGPNPLLEKLSKTVTVEGQRLVGVPDYGKRYDLLGDMLRIGIKKAIEKDAYLTVFAADGVVGKGFFGGLFNKIKDHDAVFTVPMRAAVEACQDTLNKSPGALSKEDLFNLAYNNLHPLWNASHYDAAQFSKMPYTMLWNSYRGLLARSFSVSPMLFKPTKDMLNVGMADYDLPGMFKNPLWLENWEDAPMAGFEPTMCFYPPFHNHKADPKWIGSEFGKHLRPEQLEFVKKTFYYPNKEVANISEDMMAKSDHAISSIIASKNG